MRRAFASLLLVTLCVFGITEQVQAQSFGIELHNTMMPASGGMAGASITRPQDPLSAMNANPATLTQMQGTNFTFGGALIDPKINFEQRGSFPNPAPLVTPFNAESAYPASVLGNIGVTQDLSAMDIPATLAMGFVSNAGAGVDFVGVPQSEGTASTMLIFEIIMGAGFQVTENLSFGTTFQLGSAFMDAPFVGIARNTPDYGARGTFGANYDLSDTTSVGAYFQTKQNFLFSDSILLELPGGMFTSALNVGMDLPRNVGFGIADESLMDGNLLVAVDVLFKNWEDADLFQSIYTDQWVVQVGTQYTMGRTKFRLGYAWAENPLAKLPAVTVSGITLPGATAAVNYVQAQLGLINEHRLSAGMGVEDILPGLDFDLTAGGMFAASQVFGTTKLDIESYWITFGFTWHFDGAKNCCPTQPCGQCGACGACGT